MSKIFNSDVALVIGVLSFLAGVSRPENGIAGTVIILGVLAYKSAKKRKLGIVKDTILRKVLEAIAILATFLIIFLQTDIQRLMIEDPAPNILIPIWVWGAYFYIIFYKSKIKTQTA